jgi:WD40 repeat protein/tRNA A-37 threonylcarbamoyl transferase component Bud32
LRTIFDQAVEIADADARARFLATSCGDNASLRAQVEKLLEAHSAAGGFMNAPESAPSPSLEAMGGSCAVPAGLPSERIGRYKLLQQLGEGGCGVVYLAEQQEPVKRRVALKVIKLGMDTRSVIARFEAERQALALMDHPNIARVLDAGATDTGRPFFVMELVRGVKITDYCDQNHLSTPERLQLFTQVCHAIQHAHQKGIIHRDVKPSNILVTRHDGAAVPKVIDFGIAKATTDLQLTDKTLFTQFELLIGTPAYMSPEQADLSGLDIDTRSDIYALGVLLYELLTGRTPFDTQTLLKSGLDTMRRTIRETEPPRPSTRLRTLAAADLKEVARHRQSEPLKLVSLVRGDLDWLVLKALEKDRTRRYETANALAADVRRYLADEPIVARPPGRLYALGKLMRRNKLAFAAGAAVVFALVVGLGATTALLVREQQARREVDAARLDEFRQRTEASAKAEESRRRLVRLNVSTGNRLVDETDWFAALPWFVEALRLDAGDADREDIHRRRLSAVLRAAPRLAQFWTHEGFVVHAEFSPDGTRVISSSLDHTVRVWDALTGQPVLPPLRLESDAGGACFSPDGRRVVTVDEQGRLRLWDAANGAVVAGPLGTSTGGTDWLAFTPDGRWLLVPRTNRLEFLDAATGAPTGRTLEGTESLHAARISNDGRWVAGGMGGRTVHLWDLAAHPPTRRLFKHPAGVRGLDFSHDGRRLATTTLRELSVWDVARGELAWAPVQPGGDLFNCDFSLDDRSVATASWEGRARVFDAATGLPVGDSMRHLVGVGQVLFGPDGHSLATASWDCTARLWNPRTGEPASPSLRHAGYVTTARFSPDGARLVTAGQDQTVRLWELGTNSAARLVLRHERTVTRAHFSPDGRRLLTCSQDHSARVWEAASGRPWLALPHPQSVTGGEFSRDGTRIVTATENGVAQVWDAERGERLGAAATHAKRIRHVEFSPDGQRFLTASEDATARVWDAATGQPVTPPLAHHRLVAHAAFSPDGRRVVTAAFGSRAQIWDAQTGAPLGPPLTNSCDVYRAAWSPDGRRVVTAPSDTTQLARAAQMWVADTGQRVGPPLPHIDGVFYAEFSPDGRRVATCGEDKTAAIWDAATGQRLTAPMPHRTYVMEARFSPDSRLLLTISTDSTARVWDAATGEPVTPPLRHEGPLRSGAWSPDGREVLTAGADGTARVWDVSPGDAPLAELQRQAELLSGQRLLRDIGAVPLSPAEMRERWQSNGMTKR